MRVWLRFPLPKAAHAAGREAVGKLKKWFGDDGVAVVEFDLKAGTARVVPAKEKPK